MLSEREQSNLQKIPNTVIGIVAHVDAGKTTLSEAILYNTGVLRSLGSVDAGSTALDTDELEKARGITIFSSEAHFQIEGRDFTLLDTPGHVDFSAETERTFRVLDACVLVISAPDGVQAHTRTLFRLTRAYRLPLFIFVTKTDRALRTEEEILRELTAEFGDGCLRFTEDGPDPEKAATLSEEALSEFLENGAVPDEELVKNIRDGQLIPVFFGSGLKNTGVREFLSGLRRFMPAPVYPEAFGARVFKIDNDPQGNRAVHLKVTGGSLSARELLGEEKITRIAVVNGDRFSPTDRIFAGDTAAVFGVAKAVSGSGYGYETDAGSPMLRPLISHALILPEGTDPVKLMPELKKLEEEDPLLSFEYQKHSGEIRVSLMGEIQAEVLQSLLRDRLALSVQLGPGRVRYMETPAGYAEGVGHYEPLRHYAEVHLTVEPLPLGTGILYEISPELEGLDKNYRNLVLQHLTEKEHTGVLTGSPITDVRITLVSGRAHLKHTEGGDFREATYRALKNALMYSGCRLLEPYYSFRIRLPADRASRALSDIRQRSGSFSPPVYAGNEAIVTGRAPVSTMNDYAAVLSSYTGGAGVLSLVPDGYDRCHNEEEVIQQIAYVPGQEEGDSPDSVFCSHGAGFFVPWNRVRSYMHLPLKKEESAYAGDTGSAGTAAGSGNTSANAPVSDEALEALMMKEFGPIRRPQYAKASGVISGAVKKPRTAGAFAAAKRYDLLIVDGYNVIFQWEELKALAREDIAAAREKLILILSDFTGFTKLETILVFDGYRVPGNPGESRPRDGLTVVYTRERESADLYIQRCIREKGGKKKTAVVTSDGIIQLFALKSGVLRISSAGFLVEIEEARRQIREILEETSKNGRSTIGDSGVLNDIDPDKKTE